MTVIVSLAASDRAFPVDAGETVLEGARRAGLALPYSCLSGVCGSCKATLLSGRCHYPRNPPNALSAAERARGAILPCQAVPLGDLVLAAREVTSVEDIPCRRMAAQVVAKTLVAPQVVRLELHAPESEHLLWLPGQYVDVLLDDGRRRAFSIANLARGDGRLQLHVRHVSGGGFTSWVFHQLKVGMTLCIEGPLGTFVPREDSERPMLLVAGGTGFAPIKAIVEHFLELGTARPMHVYWGARTAAELYLRGLARAWAERTPSLAFTPVVADADSARASGLRSGLVHEAVLADHPDLAGFDVYVCGPPALIDAARHSFGAAGMDDQRLYFDSFEYAPDTLAAILRGRAGIG